MPPKRKRKARGKKKVQTASPQDVKRDTFFRELKLSVLNTDRYRSSWREMLTRIKMPDLWRKVEIAWQTLEHAFDFKDYSISLLLDSLQEAEDQRRTANGAHVEMINRSLDAHETRLKVADALFYGDIETALNDKAVEFESINRCRNKREGALRKINMLVNYRGENEANTLRSIAISKIEAFAEDGKNERRIIITQLQKRLENLWNDLRNVFSDYRKSTEDRRKGYDVIRRKDQIDQQTITRQYLRISNLLEDITKFREKINWYKSEATVELQEIIREANFFHNVYRETNENFLAGCKKDKHKTLTMSREYNNTAKYLEHLTKKAERIFVYMQMCRKHETQDEKILPIVDNHPVQFRPDSDDDIQLQTVVKDFENSVNFWRRLGFAQLITNEIRIQRDELLIQANDLRKALKLHLDSEANLAMCI